MSVVNTEHVRQMLQRVLKHSTKLDLALIELVKLEGILFYLQCHDEHIVYSQGEGRVIARFACYSDAGEHAIKQPKYVHAAVYKRVL